MSKKSFPIALLALMLYGAPALRAQQSQSVQAGQTQPPEVKQFQGLEDQWSIAAVNDDQYKLEYLLSPLYVDISASGEVTTRNQQIAQLFDKGGPQLVSMEQRVVTVRTFGDTAVVSGTYIVKWRNNGKTSEERGIFTHIYARNRDHWACVNAQRTAVVDLTPGAKQKVQQKSDAEEPFHIPFFHKGAEPSSSAQGTDVPPNE